ncbi:hypothetical protein FN846DRAFT_914216 [Sphaerosporella brunnea]|uniref:Uncharacterized protein n=1 Tax=Sphaerosporella brunnea TaxID=1250544 RepID=A0A5J5EDG4_9PEZI|nr:hypothetical protein FN846DRAFT_914216 [Sphaerosporella brunnea]
MVPQVTAATGITCERDFHHKPYWRLLSRLHRQSSNQSAPLKLAGVRDRLPGESVFEDGPTTHVTGVTVDRTKVLAYFKRTIITAEHSDESTTAIDVCEHRLVWLLDDEEHMVQAGDDESAVLAAGVIGLGFIGMFVTLLTEEQTVSGDTRTLPETLGMMVLLKQIAAVTGWE